MSTYTALCYLVKVIWKLSYPAMYDASLVRLCFPDPPTPTNNAFPCGVRIIRDILIKWMIASCVLREKGIRDAKIMYYNQLATCHQATASQQLDGFSGAYAKDSVLYSSKSTGDFPLTSVDSRASPRKMSSCPCMKQCHVHSLSSAELRACPLGDRRKSRKDSSSLLADLFTSSLNMLTKVK